MDEVAIRVSGVSKNFHLPHQNKSNSIKNIFINPLGLLGGKSSKAEVQHALKDISFEIKKGEFFGIVGRNGSGKSTLLKILAGIYQPTKGKVETKGKLVPFIELGVGFNPELSGRENVYLNGALLGFTQKQVEVKYDDIVAFAELERFMDQKLKNYSSGMQVRLAFSVATVLAESDILLIDEVLAVGDADFQRKCFEYFRTLKKSKKTVVFVSHDMDAIREYCDRAAFIEKNQLIATDTPSKIAVQYTQLFSKKVNSKKTDSKRWGNYPELIKIVDTPDKIDETNKNISLKVTVKSNKVLDRPIIGYVIKNTAGQSLLGSNTKVLGINTGSYRHNEQFLVEFTIQNIFSDGNYQVDIAILGNDGVTVLDWWEGAAQFTAFQLKPSSYPVSPDVKVEINRS